MKRAWSPFGPKPQKPARPCEFYAPGKAAIVEPYNTILPMTCNTPATYTVFLGSLIDDTDFEMRVTCDWHAVLAAEAGCTIERLSD